MSSMKDRRFYTTILPRGILDTGEQFILKETQISL